MLEHARQFTAIAAMLLVCGSAWPQDAEEAPSLEERVLELERDLASLETRFSLRETREAGTLPDRGPDDSMSLRIDQLERQLARLQGELSRVQRQAESALRAADQASRQAMSAERIARDVLNRTR